MGRGLDVAVEAARQVEVEEAVGLDDGVGLKLDADTGGADEDAVVQGEPGA